MTAQLDLFGPAKPIRARRDHARLIEQGSYVKPINEVLSRAEGGAQRQLVRQLRAVDKGGFVNGMSKAALRRYAPAKLPRVTIND